MILATIIIVPFQISFDDDNELLWFSINITIDCIYTLDIFANCITAYYKENEVLEVSRKKILINYLTGWMIIDLLSAFPFELVLQSLSAKYFLKLGEFPKIYRLIKLVKITKLLNSSSQFQSISMYFDWCIKKPAES